MKLAKQIVLKIKTKEEAAFIYGVLCESPRSALEGSEFDSFPGGEDMFDKITNNRTGVSEDLFDMDLYEQLNQKMKEQDIDLSVYQTAKSFLQDCLEPVPPERLNDTVVQYSREGIQIGCVSVSREQLALMMEKCDES